MAMLKELMIHIRYPYTAGVIAMIWLGTALLVAISQANSNVAQMVLINIAATTVIGIIGFSSPRK